MDQIKIDNFLKENPELSFPKFWVLDDKNCAKISLLLSEKLRVNHSIESVNLVSEVDKLGEICSEISCNDESFDLKNVLLTLGIDGPEYVYINWYRYDVIDKMMFVDLVNNFYEIWYPAVDDLDIFDESLSWVLSVTHYGQIKILKL